MRTFYAPKKRYLDLKTRLDPPAKPSIEEQPVLELIQLPSHLRYVFLGTNIILPLILAANLNEDRYRSWLKCFNGFKNLLAGLILI